MVVEVTPAGPHVSKQRRGPVLAAGSFVYYSCRRTAPLLLPHRVIISVACICIIARQEVEPRWISTGLLCASLLVPAMAPVELRLMAVRRNRRIAFVSDCCPPEPVVAATVLYHSCCKVHTETTVHDPIIRATQQGSLLALQSSPLNMHSAGHLRPRFPACRCSPRSPGCETEMRVASSDQRPEVVD